MSATLYPTLPHLEPVAAPAARLALKTDGASRGLSDGAWWPRSGTGAESAARMLAAASDHDGPVSAAVTGQTGPPGPASRLIIGM